MAVPSSVSVALAGKVDVLLIVKLPATVHTGFAAVVSEAPEELV